MATSQNEALLVAVFRQLAVTKLDYGILGKDLGLSREAARNRWVRFQAKIMQSASSNNSAPSNASMCTTQAPKTTSPKKRAGTAKGKTTSAKKRKRASSEESEGLDWDEGVGIERDLEGEIKPRDQMKKEEALEELML
ncbi:hypothetical protein BKA65DRAFT_541226 [Rhexocercosporidium sp. MPI-PUGE-AT-0058]|nr:hypothetical protein BKA65DRAFT_541226 [Rhexocercosporidium sp. MPI-PUGE-AT-0058]